MQRAYWHISLFMAIAALTMFQGCGRSKDDPQAEAPPPAQVQHEQDGNVVQVDHPEQFPVVAATEYDSASQLIVTGAVSPDISRTVPVISLASGKIVEVLARIGDTVHKGQVLMRVRSDDVAGAFSDYRKAVADELLARAQLERANDLYMHGAIALNDLQVAQDTEDKAKVDVETTTEHLRLIGNDPNNPTTVVDVVAPISGVITDQQVTNGAGVQGLATPNPFTISDLSTVWVLCDVHEDDLPNVQLHDVADIRLNAYPGRIFKGTIGNIGSVLDPTIRTAKVRIEVSNPGVMRVGMFVTATFHGQKLEKHAQVPATAILHLHDGDWVYVPAGGGSFRRVEVNAGDMLPRNMQEVLSGITPGTQVVGKALVLENTVEQ